jgi:hypothetical protein
MTSIILRSLLIFLFSIVGIEAAPTLDLQDARNLVQHTPLFERAKAASECPETSDSTLNGHVATIIVRAGCGLNLGSGYIGSFYVDVISGEITIDGEKGPVKVDTPKLTALRKTLFLRKSKAEDKR